MSSVAIAGARPRRALQETAWVVLRVAAVALLATTCFSLMLLSDFGTGRYLLDKSWFLHVVDRVTSGEVLYRDMFFPATPLSVYLTALVTAPFGNQFLVAEAVWAFWLALLIATAARIARQLGWGDAASALLALALAVSMIPSVHSPYTLLAMLWFLVCASAALSWLSRAAADRGDLWLVAAGVAAGLCLVSKHNLGVYALAALGITIATWRGGWTNRQQWPRLAASTLLPCLLVTAVFMLPVLLSGGMAKFLEYGFGDRTTYLTAARVDYGEGLADLGAMMAALRMGRVTSDLYWQLLYLIPPLALTALIAAWLRAPGERDRVQAVTAFLLAAWLVMFPRATESYLVFVLPLALPALGYAIRILAPRPPGRASRALIVSSAFWIALGALLIGSGPIGVIVSRAYEVADLPHFHGMPVLGNAKVYYQTAQRLTEAIASDRDAPMILSTRAGFLYLASGLHDPTPYDYPLVTAFGQHGLDETLAALQDGTLPQLCVDHDFSSTSPDRRLQPKLLLRFAEEAMKPRRDLGACTLYRGRH